MYQDMAASIPSAAANANVKVCTQSIGTTISGSNVLANCQTFANSTAAGVNAGTAPADPESATTGFVLHQVDITYTFNPLIPSTAFGAVLLSFQPCSLSGGSIQCTFHRKVLMRSM
jgi:hypothetical protein